jgi:cell wall-associated NlpC family hydrolase
MKQFVNLAIGCLLLGLSSAADYAAPAVKPDTQSAEISVVPASDPLLAKAAERGDIVGRLIKAAGPTIGVRYKWGGTQLDKGIDCSNYTWQLYRSLGLGYDRFLSTMALSRVNRANGLRKVSFADALAGDLLVYGYRDEAGKWRGHVVILVDKDGNTTGHRGLVLGAHGASVDGVQFVTFNGFDKGYFKDPKMRLVNVLRADGTHERSDLE